MSWCEWPEFYSETYQRARKPHRCVECLAPIEVGERHLRYRGKWDGRLSGGRQHLLCRAACMWIRDHFQDGECIGFGELFDAFGDFHCVPKRKKADDKMRVMRRMIARIRWRERGPAMRGVK